MLSGILGRLSDAICTLQSHINPTDYSGSILSPDGSKYKFWKIDYEDRFKNFQKNQKFGLIFMVSVVNEISFVWYISCMTGTLGPG